MQLDVEEVLSQAPLGKRRKRAGSPLVSERRQDSARKRAASIGDAGDDNSDDDDCLDDDDMADGDRSEMLAQSMAAWKNSGDEHEMMLYRKERNRMHAKMTRDRKKVFASKLQQMIQGLENENRCGYPPS